MQRQEELPLNTMENVEIGDILLSARALSRQTLAQAREQADLILRDAREQSDQILQSARDRAAQTVQQAEEQAAAIRREAAEKAAAQDSLSQETAAQKEIMSAQMQEYVVACVGDCVSRLRQQQLETVDFINEQWRSFLSGLSLADDPRRLPRVQPAEEINRQDIEARVSAIAKELMEILGT